MPSDTAMQEMLYAILKQKDLKDIDWTRVATDPILTQPITNGHAARMRYSRFKKQMDRQLTPSSPQPAKKSKSSVLSTPGKHKNRVEKNRSPEKSTGSGSTSYVKDEGRKERGGTEESMMEGGNGQVKREMGLGLQLHLDPHNHEQFQQHQLSAHQEEYPTQVPTPLPSTPRYCMEQRSISPSPGLDHYPHPHLHTNQSFASGLSASDGYHSSFGLGNSQHDSLGGIQSGSLFGEVMGADFGLDQLGNIGDGSNDEYGVNWGEESGSASGLGRDMGALVKEEPRWDEEYGYAPVV